MMMSIDSYCVRIISILLFILSSHLLLSQEICDNGIDDDGDSLIDLNDSLDCSCAEPIGSLVELPIFLNGDFEDSNWCPDGISQIGALADWVWGVNATTDYHRTECSFPASPGFGIPPEFGPNNGNGLVGMFCASNWGEGVSQCLPTPLEEGVCYTIELDVRAIQHYKSGPWEQEVQVPITLPPFPLAIHGRTNCAATTLTNGPVSWPTGLGCPDDFTELGSVMYEMNEDWQTLTIEFTCPIDVNEIIIMQGCDLPVDMPMNTETDLPYLNLDNVRFTNAFECNNLPIVTSGSLCSEDLVLSADLLEGTDSYQWFKDGVAIPSQIGTSLEVSNFGLGSGSYQFRFFQDGECMVIEYEVEEHEWSDISVSIQPNSGCAELFVDFSSSFSDLPGHSFEWSFGDGEDSEFDSPEHIYTDAGSYDVLLQIQAPNGCVIDTLIEDAVLVFDPPLVEFSSNINSVCVGEQVQFSNETPLSQNCNWSIGNSIETSECSPLVLFSEEGIYNVSLSIEFDENCTGNTTIEEMIEVHPLPSAFFETEPICSLGMLAAFTNIEASPDISVNNFWVYGDGSEGTANSHIYNSPGIYEVSHLVISDEGCENSTTAQQVVSVIDLGMEHSALQGCSPHEVSFIPIVSYWNETSELNYLWEMNETVYTNQEGVSVVFENNGHETSLNYSVALFVSDMYGCSESVVLEDLIEVWPIPIAEFIVSNPEQSPNQLEVSFQNESIGGDSFLWDFGDGETSSNYEPVHTFDQAQTGVQISLLTTNNYGCSDIAFLNIDLNYPVSIYVPNAFTPNGDGLNEIFQISSSGILNPFKLEIFNRWGELVYTSTDTENGWLGNHQNGDYFVPDGVYTYRIEYGNDGKLLDAIYGSVTLIR